MLGFPEVDGLEPLHLERGVRRFLHGIFIGVKGCPSFDSGEAKVHHTGAFTLRALRRRSGFVVFSHLGTPLYVLFLFIYRESGFRRLQED